MEKVKLTKEEFIKQSMNGEVFKFNGDEYFYDEKENNPFRISLFGLEEYWGRFDGENEFTVVDKFAKLKKCEKLGAIFEYKRKVSHVNWIQCINNPLWSKNTQYRILGNITPDQFLKHHKEIIAYWEGAKIEYRCKTTNTKWKQIDNPAWLETNEYRIAEELVEYFEVLIPSDTGYLIGGTVYTKVALYNNANYRDFIKTGRSWVLPKRIYDDITI